MFENAKWLGVPRSEIEKWNILEGDMTGRFAYFRTEVTLEEPGNLNLEITANARYRLWINEHPAASGPCKGDGWRQYGDSINVSQYLQTGKNVIAVQVLYQNPYSAIYQTDERAAIFGVANLPDRHRLAAAGQILDDEGRCIGDITTGIADWRVYLEGSYYLKSYEVTENLGAVCEEIDCKKAEMDWRSCSLDISSWAKTELLEDVKLSQFRENAGLISRYLIEERPIPMPAEYDRTFQGNVCVKDYAPLLGLGQGYDVVPAGTKRQYILDAGKLVTGYPSFRFAKGRQAKISISYFEKFIRGAGDFATEDAEHGVIYGITDQLVLNGREIFFAPFWYRTFRYISITVEAQEEDVTVYVPDYRRTHYPLGVTSEVISSESWVGDVWDMSIRTLRNCMMETYMDCPYYEQMQFPMDTRLQVLFNYAVSRDRRLAKKALTDYHYGMMPNGLIPGKYPSAYCQIISTFSLHYIYMMEEYYKETADKDFIKEILPDADRILAFYDRKTGEDGLVGRLGCWEFVDWQPEWIKKSFGMPEAVLCGPSTIINLMYAYALKCASYLAESTGRKGLAEEYEGRRQGILQRLQQLCWDDDRRMFREGPDFAQYTQHAQAWAVLNELGSREQQRDSLQHAYESEDVLKVTFSTSYEWLRALQQAGLYRLSERNMEQWINLAKEGHTTCPETPGDSRSECHAWSALPLYEMVRGFAGINMQEAGWKSVVIHPQLLSLEQLSGAVETDLGRISFEYQKKETGWSYRIMLPEKIRGSFVKPDGSVHLLVPGKMNEM